MRKEKRQREFLEGQSPLEPPSKVPQQKYTH